MAAPDLSQPNQFDNPSGALARRAGALAKFYSDLGVWADASGTLTDEFTVPTTQGSSIDRRALPGVGGAALNSSVYAGPETRTNALTAIALLERYSPTAKSYIGELFAALGTIETVMGENMCSGVSLATVNNGIPVAGQPLDRDALFEHALTEFDSAARYYAGDSVRLANWVAVGRARALLDLDSTAGAAGAVAGVSTTYKEWATFSSSATNQNQMAVDLTTTILAVSDHEGVNGLDFVSGNDPRVPIVDMGVGADGVTPLYIYLPYDSLGKPILIASGIEARLIEAEARLRAGDIDGWSASLNALRADSNDTGTPGLANLSADSTTTATNARQVAVMFRERAFWLFGTAHRLGDMRRLVRQYHLQQEQVFPTGTYKNGQSYGTDVTFPVVGDNPNPNVPECIDRSA